MVGRYRVVGRIGSGWMATVYAGVHTALRHRVAIKVLHPEHSANPRMRMRLFNEARAVAAIRHPGIVGLFDIGRTEDGRTYIVLELLDGESLDTRLERGPLPAETAVRFARQIAGATAAGHARGIVHRDLKPQNIFIVPDAEVEGGERVKVLDFGIAKRTEGTPMPEITRTGVALGTPAYMSPEQCRGDDAIDHRADIYSLGVVLYQMVTGRVPFADASTDEQLDHHQYARPPAAVCDDPVVVEVIARCLAKEPGQRFGSMDEVVAALDGTAPVGELEMFAGSELLDATEPFDITGVGAVRGTRVAWLAAATAGVVLAALAVVAVVSGGSDEAATAADRAAGSGEDRVARPAPSLIPAPRASSASGIPATPAVAIRRAKLVRVSAASEPEAPRRVTAKPTPAMAPARKRRPRAVATTKKRQPVPAPKHLRRAAEKIVERTPTERVTPTKERSFATVRVPAVY